MDKDQKKGLRWLLVEDFLSEQQLSSLAEFMPLKIDLLNDMTPDSTSISPATKKRRTSASKRNK